MFITVDCGTTNMRCRLFDGTEIHGEAKRKAGVRNTAFDGTADFLRISLHDCIAELLEKHSLQSEDIEAVICVGTLSSDVGIYRVPHVSAPVGPEESAAHAKVIRLPEICDIPIMFIPGTKTQPDKDVKNELDLIYSLESLSGEDVEAFGIMKQLGLTGDLSITLPGSYNKVLDIDEKGRLRSFVTGMCGEFLAAISEHTLLKHSLTQPLIETIIPEKLILGYEYAEKYGTSPSLIKGRMMQFLWDYTEQETANFFVGAALHDDILITAKSAKPGKPLLLGGGDPLRTVFRIILEHIEDKTGNKLNIICVDDETARLAPIIGAIMVYNKYREINK